MCGGGGGGGGGGNDWTYQANIDRDIAANKQKQTDADKADAEQAKVDTRANFGTALTAGQTKGWTDARKYLSDRGLPVDDATIQTVLDNISAQIPDLDPTPGKYFTNEAYGQQFDTLAQGTRDKLSNQITSTFTPGFEKTLISDTADDPYISSILGEQRTNAQKIIDFNKARGLLNDTGYQAAVGALGTQGTAAQGTLDQIGQSVLGKYRQGLTDIKGEAGTAASGYTYGASQPDISSYYTRAANTAGENLAGLEGSIRGAVGTTNYFDAPLALQKGGTLQGPINLTTRPAGFAPQTDKKDQGRGLGSSGVF